MGATDRINYRVGGRNGALVASAIHSLEHFHRLTNRENFGISLAKNSKVVDTKRRGFAEVLGRLTGTSETGHSFDIDFSVHNADSFLKVEIEVGPHRWVVDEVTCQSFYYKRGNLAERLLISTPLQSKLTNSSILEIRANRTPHWAPLPETLYVHKQLLGALVGLHAQEPGMEFT